MARRIADERFDHRTALWVRFGSMNELKRSAPRTSRFAWLPVAAASMGAGWGSNQFTPMLLVYRQALGLGTGTLEAMFGFYALGLIPGLLLAAARSDARGRRNSTLLAIAAAPALGTPAAPARRRAQNAPGGVCAAPLRPLGGPRRHGGSRHFRARRVRLTPACQRRSSESSSRTGAGPRPMPARGAWRRR